MPLKVIIIIAAIARYNGDDRAKYISPGFQMGDDPEHNPMHGAKTRCYPSTRLTPVKSINGEKIRRARNEQTLVIRHIAL